MSLIHYRPNSEWSVVLHNEPRRALVLYNRHTGETTLVDDYLVNPSIDLSTNQLQYLSNMKENSKDLVIQDNHIFQDNNSSQHSIETIPYCQYCGQFISSNRHSNSIGGSELPEVSPPRRYSETYESGDDLSQSNYYEFNPTNAPMVTLPMPSSFVSSDYFLLLDSNERNDPAAADDKSDTNDFEGMDQQQQHKEPIYASISESAFSQGYFNKFFKSIKILGRGARGSVYLVEHVLDGVSLGLFACKKVSIGDDHQWLEKVLHEVNMLRVISHSNLVKYNHVWLENSSTTAFGPAVPCAYILQEYCAGGTLEDYVKKRTQAVGSGQIDIDRVRQQRRRRRRSMAEGRSGIDLERDEGDLPKQLLLEEIYSIMKDITLGVLQLHKSHIIHRDLKPSNCLLSQEISEEDDARSCLVLVSDFGEGQVEGKPRSATGVTGTLEYCAPELLQVVSGEFGQFSTKSDIFSLGMILHFLLFSRLPYNHDPALQISESPVSGSLRSEKMSDFDGLRNEVANFGGFDIHNLPTRVDVPGGLYQLLARMVSTNPQERPTAGEILKCLDTLSDVPLSSQHKRDPNLDTCLKTSNTTHRTTEIGSSLIKGTSISSRALSSTRQRVTILSNTMSEAVTELSKDTPLSIIDMPPQATSWKLQDVMFSLPSKVSTELTWNLANRTNMTDWLLKGLLILVKLYSIYGMYTSDYHKANNRYIPLAEGILLVSMGMEIQTRSRQSSIYYFVFHFVVVYLCNWYRL
ncbi:kinase-like protein [Nadsonia fulvescens var. elongata DSM 6958]|uniref:non-specific serine/threonine protein kinase n=1 Tax=Nadsonia fulvescens var. elongata DSM 6958 TaxID=857566 RepID=A0A1E3PF94_9ASCO|nr:kinase-like protein [Nadsonia fulvescens var. elongata DSM 6958]